jgi:hypothetical protein
MPIGHLFERFGAIRDSRRLWLALIGSFGIYFLPIVGPHGLWLFGDALLRQFSYSTRERGWIAAHVALAFTLQAGAALLLLWILRRPFRLRALWILAAFPVFTVALNVSYLGAIPLYFLIESDTAAERQDWDEHCTIADAALLEVRTPISQTANGFAAWWVSRRDGRYALLSVPACEVIEASLQAPAAGAGGRVDFMMYPIFATADGAALFERHETAGGRRRWLVLRTPEASAVPLPVPDIVEKHPILSNDGRAVAWLEPVKTTQEPEREVLQVHFLSGNDGITSRDELTQGLKFMPQDVETLLEVDTAARDLTVWQNDGARVLSLESGRPPRLLPATGVEAQYTTYRRCGSGWFAWDAYRENGPYVAAWSLAAGTGEHRVPKGRRVTSAAVDPAGRYLAMSTTTALSIGQVKDAVFVLRASDGAEVFRRYLPAYSRSTVVFLGREFFAYSEGGRTHVLRLPG